jgi:hypothetical protein
MITLGFGLAQSVFAERQRLYEVARLVGGGARRQ